MKCVKKPTNNPGTLAKALLGKQPPNYLHWTKTTQKRNKKFKQNCSVTGSLEQLHAGQDVTAAKTAVIPCPVHNYLWYLATSKHNFRGVPSAIGGSPDHRGTCPFLAVQGLQDNTSMINTGNWWGAPNVQTNFSRKTLQCFGWQSAETFRQANTCW